MDAICAVCKQCKGSIKCEICGFSDNGVINREFPIVEDANHWLETIVKSYRNQWLSGLLSHAASLYKKEQYNEFINYITEIIKITPKVFCSFLLRASAYKKIKKYNDAIKDFNESFNYTLKDQKLPTNEESEIMGLYFSAFCLKLHHQIEFMSINRAFTYMEIGQYEKAITDFSEVIKHKPKKSIFISFRGIAYFNNGQFNEALKDYSEAIELDSFDLEDIGYNPEMYCDRRITYIHRGILYIKTDQYEKAIDDFTIAIKLKENDPVAYYERGCTYLHGIENVDQAIVDFNKVIQLDADNVYAYLKRGITYFRKKEYDRALLDFNKGIQLDPNNVELYLTRGMMYQDIENLDKAIADFSAAIHLAPNDEVLYALRSNTYRQNGDFNKAISDYNKLIQLNPNYGDV